MTGSGAAIAGYDAAAGELAERYDDPALLTIHDDLHHYLPERCQGKMALDVGARSGRDAGWLAGLGFQVVAVADCLPGLARVHTLALGFDLILLSAVWQHVALDDRARAFRKLATLMKPGGLLALSLRSGAAPPDRPMFEVSIGDWDRLRASTA